MGVFGYDLTDPALYENGFPHRVFTGIRRDCPVAWHDEAGTGPVPNGLWSIAGHPEVVTVLERCEVESTVPDTLVADAAASCVLELARRPDLFAIVRRDGIGTTVDELARWVCPEAAVRCRAVEEFVLGRHRVAPGERLVCWLPSANRDETVFGRDAMDLVIDRTPNPHLTFCRSPDGRERLVEALADLLAGVSRLELTGEPEWVRSVERSALEGLPVEFVVE